MLKEVEITWYPNRDYDTNFGEELTDSDHEVVMDRIQDYIDDGDESGVFTIEVDPIEYGFDYNFGPQMEFPEKTLLIMAEARGVYFLHTMAYTYDPEHARYVAAKKIETFYDNARFLDYQILNKPMEDVTMDESNDWLDRMSMEYTMTRAK